MKKFNVKWSKTVRILTVVVFVALFFAGFRIVTVISSGYSEWFLYLTLAVLFLTVAYIIVAPNYIVLTDKSLILKKLVGTKEVRFEDISEISVFRSDGGDIRLFGSGGYGGYLGLFSNSQIGKYTAYAGDMSQAFLVQIKNGKNYVFSCESRDLVIETIKKAII